MPKTNSNTSKGKSPIQSALAAIPVQFQERIVRTYLELKQKRKEGNHEGVGLAVGKLAEAVLRFLQHQLTNSYIPFGQQIHNFADECRKLVQLSKTVGTESERVVIPRALVFLYTLRSKRGIAHQGGDVDANPIDAMTIARVSDWIICELIRIYHKLSLEEAQAIVDALSTRDIPAIWEVAGKKRVLKQSLDYKQKVLLLCYQDPQAGVLEEDLLEWTEYSSPGMFRKSVLTPLHDKRMIEYDNESQIIYVSPLGIKEVEDTILK